MPTLCRHIKTNGTRCKALSLTGGVWCYFHQNLHQRHRTYRHTEATRGYLVPGQHIELTALEDRESVQVALSCVINALATGRLETKRATALLYGLQLASHNARTLITEPSAHRIVRSVEPSPEGLDLAEPLTVEEEPELNLTWDPIDEEEEENDEDDEEDEGEEEDIQKDGTGNHQQTNRQSLRTQDAVNSHTPASETEHESQKPAARS